MERKDKTRVCQNPMIFYKLLALLACFVLISMISSLRFAKRAPTFSSKFRNAMQCSSGSLASLKTLVSHPSYDKIDTFSVDEYGLQGVLYKHRKSGAEVVSIAAPDDNKVFGITFRTPPKDRLLLSFWSFLFWILCFCLSSFAYKLWIIFIFTALVYLMYWSTVYYAAVKSFLWKNPLLICCEDHCRTFSMPSHILIELATLWHPRTPKTSTT